MRSLVLDICITHRSSPSCSSDARHSRRIPPHSRCQSALGLYILPRARCSPLLLELFVLFHTRIESLPHESVANIVFLEAFLRAVHHDYFVPDSSELDRVADIQFVALSWHEVVVPIVAHVPHDQPKLVTRIGFLVLCVVYFESVVHPVVVVLEQTCCSYPLLGTVLLQSFVI